MGILIGMGVPSFQGLRSQSLAEALAYQLQYDLYYAQTQALKRNQKIILCPTEDNIRCSESWHASYLIGYLNPNNTITPLKIQQNKSKIKMSFQALKFKMIIFNERGHSQNQGSIFLQHDKMAWRLVLLHSGRVRLEKIIASTLSF